MQTIILSYDNRLPESCCDGNSFLLQIFYTNFQKFCLPLFEKLVGRNFKFPAEWHAKVRLCAKKFSAFVQISCFSNWLNLHIRYSTYGTHGLTKDLSYLKIWKKSKIRPRLDKRRNQTEISRNQTKSYEIGRNQTKSDEIRRKSDENQTKIRRKSDENQTKIRQKSDKNKSPNRKGK